MPPLRSGAFRSWGLQRQCRWEAGGVAAMGRTSDFFALPSTEGRAVLSIVRPPWSRMGGICAADCVRSRQIVHAYGSEGTYS